MAIIGGSVAIEKDGKFYNTTYVYNKSGDLINTYSKVHLFGLMAEDQYMSAGSSESVFELDAVTAASVICYDIRFPELGANTDGTRGQGTFCGSAVARTSCAAMGDFVKGACG